MNIDLYKRQQMLFGLVIPFHIRVYLCVATHLLPGESRHVQRSIGEPPANGLLIAFSNNDIIGSMICSAIP